MFDPTILQATAMAQHEEILPLAATDRHDHLEDARSRHTVVRLLGALCRALAPQSATSSRPILQATAALRLRR